MWAKDCLLRFIWGALTVLLAFGQSMPADKVQSQVIRGSRVYPAGPVPITEDVLIYSQSEPGSAENIARKGILVRFKNAKATILVAHGFMCNKYDVGFLRNLFPYGQYNFLTFDFRAHGDDKEGQVCTLGKHEALDVIAAAKFLRSHPDLKNKPLFVYAFSMGAVASIEAQSQDSSLFDAMILDCPFDSTEKVLNRLVNNIKFTVFGYEFRVPGSSILQKYAFHPYVQSLIKMMLKAVAQLEPRHVDTNVSLVVPAQSVTKIKVPCFFIHCKNDEKVPVSAVKEVYKGAAGPKMLWITNGRFHYDSYFYNPERYIYQVRLFIEQVLAGQWNNPAEQRIIQDKDNTFAS
jgi:pimeloyl-ACP methyl ester carboxylesterase